MHKKNEDVFVKLSPTMGLLIQGICHVKYMLCYLFNIYFFDLMIIIKDSFETIGHASETKVWYTKYIEIQANMSRDGGLFFSPMGACHVMKAHGHAVRSHWGGSHAYGHGIE
jgi:hypothetical protein